MKDKPSGLYLFLASLGGFFLAATLTGETGLYALIGWTNHTPESVRNDVWFGGLAIGSGFGPGLIVIGVMAIFAGIVGALITLLIARLAPMAAMPAFGGYLLAVWVFVTWHGWQVKARAEKASWKGTGKERKRVVALPVEKEFPER